MNYLLHIDTSGDVSNIAVGGDGQLLAAKQSSESRNHASSVNVMIGEVLSAANITMQQLSGVVVCAGPGSYTGLRIGLSTAKGICYALNLPLIMDNKLTLLANQAFKKHGPTYEKYFVAIQAREQEYFISVFDNNFTNIVPAKHITATELKDYLQSESHTYIITDCLSADEIQNYVHSFVVDTEVSININDWLFLSSDEYKCNNIVNLSTAEPFYLKQVYTHK
jgi:tRNA threonylcarbamoyladenosine biosynthesis protein TsaB